MISGLVPCMQAAPKTTIISSPKTCTITLGVLTRRKSLLVNRSAATGRSTRRQRTCHSTTRWSLRERISQGGCSLLALAIQRCCSPRKLGLVSTPFAEEQRLFSIHTASTRVDLVSINILRPAAIAVPGTFCSIRLQVMTRQAIVSDAFWWLFLRRNTPSATFRGCQRTPSSTLTATGSGNLGIVENTSC